MMRPQRPENAPRQAIFYATSSQYLLSLRERLDRHPVLAASLMQSLQRKRRPFGCSRAQMLKHRRVSAFSIFELVIVCLIMSILGAVAAPTFFDSLLFHRVESAARRVKADLELARTQARLTSASQSVTFTGSVYTLSNTKSLDKPGSVYSV